MFTLYGKRGIVFGDKNNWVCSRVIGKVESFLVIRIIGFVHAVREKRNRFCDKNNRVCSRSVGKVESFLVIRIIGCLHAV